VRLEKKKNKYTRNKMPPMKKTSVPKKVKKVLKKTPPKKVVDTPKQVVDTPKKVVETPKQVVETPKPVDAPIVDQTEGPNLYAVEFTHVLGQLKILQQNLRDLTVYASKLEKTIAKDQKVLHKKAQGKVKRKNAGNKSPSGFSKPGQVSSELRTFLKIGKDELVARTEVTKKINIYCKEKGLQDMKDKRKLLPDKTLTKLLRIKKGEELTFFNLQKYMKVHFPNKDGVYPTA